jgi:hypothetical protein
MTLPIVLVPSFVLFSDLPIPVLKHHSRQYKSKRKENHPAFAAPLTRHSKNRAKRDYEALTLEQD